MGTIGERTGKRGATYRVRVELPPDPATGTRRWRTGTFKEQDEAERAARRWRVEVDEGARIAPSSRTLAHFCADWIAGQAAVRESTWVRHEADVRLRIVPHLGNVALRDLDAPRIQRWVARIGKEFAPATVARAYAVLHATLDAAVTWNLIAANPCRNIVLPRPAHRELSVWDEGQVRRFLAATRDCPYAALWRLAVLVGLRKGEILALQWRDFDAARRTLAIRRTLTRTKDLGYTIGPPKTQAGVRTIALPRAVLAPLVRRRAMLLRPPQGEAFIFPGRCHGFGVLHENAPNAMLDNIIDTANEEAGEIVLPRLRFHDLRHTAATLALVQGVSPRVVQERLGHSSLAMTLGLYSHVTLTLQGEAADKMDAMFSEVEDLDRAADD